MLSSPPDQVLSVDIGGTSVRIGLIDASGKLLGDITRYAVPFAADGAASVDGLLALIKPHVVQAKQRVEGELFLGIGLCGNIAPSTGEVRIAPNLRWRNVPLAALVSERFRVPALVGMDVRFAALGEAVWGAARDERNFAWATVGTGYGGYLVLNGRLYGGTRGFAGNFGHITWDEVNGYPCGCGRRGCVETYVAGPAIARAGQAAVDAGHSQILATLAAEDRVSTTTVFSAIELGDEIAKQIVEDAIRLICINLAGVVNLLDINMVVMGGGVALGVPWFIERVSTRIRDYLMTVEARRDLKVIHETFPDSTLWGAAANVFAVEGTISANILEESLEHRAIRAY